MNAYDHPVQSYEYVHRVVKSFLHRSYDIEDVAGSIWLILYQSRAEVSKRIVLLRCMDRIRHNYIVRKTQYAMATRLESTTSTQQREVKLLKLLLLLDAQSVTPVLRFSQRRLLYETYCIGGETRRKLKPAEIEIVKGLLNRLTYTYDISQIREDYDDDTDTITNP